MVVGGGGGGVGTANKYECHAIQKSKYLYFKYNSSKITQNQQTWQILFSDLCITYININSNAVENKF